MRLRLYVLVMLGMITVSAPAAAQSVVLECARGERNVGKTCVKVSVPENGELDYLGHDWQCQRGFRKMGKKCVEVVVPENGELDYLGHDWQCQRGFRKMGRKCVEVVVPENGELDYLGHDWQCQRGFRKMGKKCVEVVVPENGELDYVGNDWVCSRGFRRSGGRCIAMSAAEQLAADRRFAAREAHGRQLASASCEIDGSPAVGDHAEVIQSHSGCQGYFVADGPSGHYLLEWYGGYEPDEGDLVIGPIDGYGFKDVCYPGHGQGRVWVDDYLLGKARALEKLAGKCR